MKNELLDQLGDLADSGALTVALDEQLQKSGRSPIEVWEGQLKTELIQLPPHIRSAAGKYVEMIIGYSRGGFLEPGVYADHIRLGNEEYAGRRDWHFYAESAVSMHDQMIQESGNGTDEIAKKVAATLSESFNGIISQVGPLDDGVMNRTLGILFEKISWFPRGATPSAAT